MFLFAVFKIVLLMCLNSLFAGLWALLLDFLYDILEL